MPALSTNITAVTVYTDRARVTRSGTLTLDPGAQTVLIDSLPRQMDQSSVRATATGNGKLTGVQVNLRHTATTAPGAAQDAQAKLQALLDQDRALADEEDGWKARFDIVKNIGAEGGESFSRNLARGKLTVQDLTGTLDYLSQSQQTAAANLRDLAARRRDLALAIEAAKAEAEKLQNGATYEAFEVGVNLKVSAVGPVTIELTYTVYGASWDALYDVRLDNAGTGDNALEWNYLAQVQQQTGEDWNLPLALTLSTATLAVGLDKPELSPWHIDAYRPPEPRQFKTRAVGGAPAPQPMMAMSAESMAVNAAPMAYAQATIESSGPNVTYRIPTPRSIPSDGEPHQVSIATLPFSAALDYFAAPKVDEHSFVRAKFSNTSAYLMLTGEMSLYHGPDFVGTRTLETIVPGQEVELFLGADERVQVERQEIERSVDKNLLGNTARTQLGYRIRVKNPSQPRIHITVLDQIPVSQHPDIKVKLRDANPKPARQNEQGELAWELDVAQGATAEITFAITIEYPKDLRVAGL